MNILLIVESPTKQKTFEKYVAELRDTYTIASSKGHVRDLAIKGPQGFGVDIEQCFQPTYTVIKGKEKLVETLTKQAKKMDKVILATDPDREGESIAWHLADALQLESSKIERIEFYEITKSKILEAIAHPRPLNMDMVQSQEARRILDRIVGFMLSKILTKKVYSPAGGRVQSVALRFVIEREVEVLAFVPQTYYSMNTSINTAKGNLGVEVTSYQGQSLKVTDDKTDPKGFKKIIPLHSKEKVESILASLPSTVTLTDVSMQKKKRESKAAFRTSTLQQDASSYLKFSPKKTQKIAQELYEGVNVKGEQIGLITYMRTDSDRLSSTFTDEATSYIRSTFGEAYVSSTPKSKTVVLQSQDAHEAIRPTSVDRTPESMEPYLSSDQLKLYRLIFNRSLASLMTAQQYETTTYTFTGGDFTLKASGSVVTFPGFRRAYGMSEETDEPELPQLFKGEAYPLTHKGYEDHQTAGPSRFSEAKLIQELEYQGIGRPSTYAATIDRLKQHHYVSVKGNTLYPNPEAHAAITYLVTYFSDFINARYTSEMELKLDEVKDGEKTRCELLSAFYTHFKEQYDAAGDLPKEDPSMQFYGKCPIDGCNGVIVPRRSKFGVFLGCSNYPTCTYNSNQVPFPWPEKVDEDHDEPLPDGEGKVFKPKERPVAEEVGRPCPKCGKPLLKRMAKRTKRPFIGCSGFPKCDYLENITIPSKKDA